MLTYQVRPRIYRCDKGKFIFPNDCELIFYFQPLQPFGKESGGGRTAVRAVAATVLFNMNTGHHSVQSKDPLKPLEIIIEEPIRYVEMHGNELHVRTRFESLKEMDEIIQSLFFAFPILLNVEFTDPPFIVRVAGTVGDVSFGWELEQWLMKFQTTTQELQEERVTSSWERLNLLSNPHNRRVVAALHYFHVACRLCRAGNFPWEFMSEIILNLSKVLEVLFPPTTKAIQTLDAARTGLTNIGFSSTDIERYFIPIMALRNHIDSAHVDLSIFTMEQLRVLHAYTEAAENIFRDMLKILVKKMQTGQYTPIQYGNTDRRKDAEKIVERIAMHCVKR
jgi:hypothetical protein